VNTTLQTLIELQDVDSVILDLQQKIAELPEIVQQLDKQLADHENQLLTIQSRLEEQEKLRRTKELDVETRLDKIKKYQGQLLQVKTNKEYAALLTEIQGLKTQNSLTEDDILELMESIERAKITIAETQREVKEEKSRIRQIKQEKESEHEEMQQILVKENKKRSQLVDTIEEKIVNEYSKLLKLRNGVAVASVEEGGICSGCHVALTPQMFAEVKTGKYLHRCPTCFRFLHWSNNSMPQEEEG
jgi:predicted  nucleic acid-binding Zn-ribbon protein